MIACETIGTKLVSLVTSNESVKLKAAGAGADAEYWMDKVLFKTRSSGIRSYLTETPYQ
jgi:hypothetical protein